MCGTMAAGMYRRCPSILIQGSVKEVHGRQQAAPSSTTRSKQTCGSMLPLRVSPAGRVPLQPAVVDGRLRRLHPHLLAAQQLCEQRGSSC